MSSNQQQTVIYRSDYQAPAYFITKTDLIFELDERNTLVTSMLQIERNLDHGKGGDLVLNGENLELRTIELNGQQLAESAYRLDEDSLTIVAPPENFTLKIVNTINPSANLALEGLYLSDGMFCTQCEAEGFRRITYYLDRPDVMSVFSVKIIANQNKYPVLLSNGNKVSEGNENGRHFVEWHDPFKKPCYLFALVAGDLDKLEDSFTTQSGREVKLQIYVETKDIDKCDHAMSSLKNAMRWDEEEYGREYDLDLYMIVAVDFFNMGAMENKGLNIFNTSCVLAHPSTQTDAAFQRVEAVIAHEYFHNWSGNRVTCQDWFQLSLKEGFTVFRDACFSADMNSAGVKRVEDVSLMRSAQFAEDAGPMAHPIRPDSFIEISNFYTLTIYEKGAEVIRMMQRLIGKDAFRKGSDLYFERHDGQAVTCEDFIVAMADASGKDLSQFRHWYSQAGTPELTISDSWDADTNTYTLEITQQCPPTPGQEVKQPFTIPIDIALHISADAPEKGAQSQLIVLTEKSQKFEFGNMVSKPFPAILRGFSAPVKFNYEYSDEQLLYLIKHESDGFIRWDASRRYLIALISEDMNGSLALDSEKGKRKISELASLFGSLILNGLESTGGGATRWNAEVDAAMLAELIALPSIDFVIEQFDVVAIDKLNDTLQTLRKLYANELASVLEKVYLVLREQLLAKGEYQPIASDIALRSLKNVALLLLLQSEQRVHMKTAITQFDAAANMTDQFTALQALVRCQESSNDGDVSGSLFESVESALNKFYEQWKGESLVVNQWLTLQASQNEPDTLIKVKALQQHSAYDNKNPNKVRALIGGFYNGSPRAFHADDGSGYQFLAEEILRLDELNPQLASRLLTPLTKWRRFAEPNASLMKNALVTIRNKKMLSSDVYEVITKSLEHGRSS